MILSMFAKPTPSTFLSLWISLSAVSVCKMIPVFEPLYTDRRIFSEAYCSVYTALLHQPLFGDCSKTGY